MISRTGRSYAFRLESDGPEPAAFWDEALRFEIRDPPAASDVRDFFFDCGHFTEVMLNTCPWSDPWAPDKSEEVACEAEECDVGP
jgi:hypothetical protein